MSREVPEWIGATDDTPVPARVRARVIDRAGDCCEHCGGRFRPQNPPEIDHRVALIAGGENREANLQALHRDCHRGKTAGDVAEKAKVARVRAKHLGLKDKPRIPVGGWAAQKFKRTVDGRVVPR